MSVKAIIYVLVTILVIWAMDCININGIFKKNKIAQARLFYLFLAFSLVYLVTNFIWDFYLATKFY